VRADAREQLVALVAAHRAAQVPRDLRVGVQRRERGLVGRLPRAQQETLGLDHALDDTAR
jgi:hypothetical protein